MTPVGAHSLSRRPYYIIDESSPSCLPVIQVELCYLLQPNLYCISLSVFHCHEKSHAPHSRVRISLSKRSRLLHLKRPHSTLLGEKNTLNPHVKQLSFASTYTSDDVMVEPSSGAFILRDTTPTPRVFNGNDALESPTHHKNSSANSPVFYDTAASANSSGVYQEGLEGLDHSMPNDATRGGARDRKPGSVSFSDQSRSNRGRSSRSHSSSRSHHRPPNTRASSSSSSILNYPGPSAPSSENAHNITPPPGYQGSALHYPNPAMPYAQRPGFRPYMISGRPSVSMNQTPPPHFGYTHAYHYPGVPDASLMPQNIHVNYQQTMRSSGSIYPYQNHSPEGITGTHNQFSNAVAPPMYPHLNTSPSVHSHSVPQPPGQSGAHSTSYGGSPQFHSFQYPTHMSPTQFAYPPQSFQASPHIYPGHYAPSPYARHFPSPPQEPDQQGTWWYLPHSVSSPSYEGHYPMTYATMGHHEMDAPYSADPSNSPAAQMYPITSLRPGPQPGANQEPEVSSPRILDSVSPLNVDGTSSPSSEQPHIMGRPVVRKSYHPNPPTHRSEWVMWAGNVPSDATHDELWRFFNKMPEALPSAPDGAEERGKTGVLSIFLISRSSCAFVNFDTEQHLHGAIEWFNGKPLRPQDSRCPKLVCRVRKQDDDLKAGVGGQRGMGMHTRWVKEQKKKGGLEQGDVSEASTSDERLSLASSDQLVPIMSTMSISSDDEGHPQRTTRHSGSSGSFASTNSSILSRYFPSRFFILKSLTQFDLDLSVEKGLWATQKHNEGILDQAYRTSQNVYLIFSVNKSGEFYGYARMAGPVRRGEHRVSWATRTTGSSGSSRSSVSPATGFAVGPSPEESTSSSRPTHIKAPPPVKNIFTPHHLVDESPQPAGLTEMRHARDQAGHGPEIPRSPGVARAGVVQSAPADLGERQQMAAGKQVGRHSLDPQIAWTAPTVLLGEGEGDLDDFELDPAAPIRAMRAGSGQSHESNVSALSRGGSVLHSVAEEEEKGGESVAAGAGEREEQGAEAKEETWGESFKVEWLCTDKLPFHRTRHIRNPWNHDREVKVSRDGTEIEPTVGQALLDEWARLVEMPTPLPVKMGGSASKRGLRSAPPIVAPIALKAESPTEGKVVESIEAEVERDAHLRPTQL